MSSPTNTELVREIAERIDDGRRVNLRILSGELGVERTALRAAYAALTRQRGRDPLLDRARRHLDAAGRYRPRRR